MAPTGKATRIRFLRKEDSGAGKEWRLRAREFDKKNKFRTGHGADSLYIQHLEGMGRKIESLKPARVPGQVLGQDRTANEILSPKRQVYLAVVA